MMPTGGGLFYCPSCGTVGTPLCPYCNARMTGDPAGAGPGASAPVAALGGFGAPGGFAAPTLAPPAPPQVVPGGFGGQFMCPACNLTGLPNWSAGGTPRCPQCNGAMTPRGAAP
jgi:hypothetical protein